LHQIWCKRFELQVRLRLIRHERNIYIITMISNIIINTMFDSTRVLLSNHIYYHQITKSGASR
jgi:hypothetical protein